MEIGKPLRITTVPEPVPVRRRQEPATPDPEPAVEPDKVPA